MSGLRERQKQKRRDAIIAAAGELFGQQGYAATSMELIAERAELAVSTLYQYFTSKAELAEEIYLQDRRLIAELAEKSFENLPDDPVEAIMGIYRIDIDNTVSYANRKTWREMMVAALSSPAGGTDLAWPFRTEELAPFKRVLVLLRDRGLLVRDLDVETVAEVLSAISSAHFLARIAPPSRIDLPKLRLQVAQVIDGLRPDHGVATRRGRRKSRKRTKG